MTRSIADLTKTSSSALSAQELLLKSPDVLLGVSTDAAAELLKLGIATVFDLASSSVFETARKMANAADPSSPDFTDGGIAGDLIDTAARNTKLAKLPLESIEILRAIGPMQAQALSAALGVTNIREFALWPPYQSARSVLSTAFGLDPADVDAESPSELVPGSRRYPTERVQYEVLVLDELDIRARDSPTIAKAARQVEPVAAVKPLEEAGQLDLTVIATETAGFTRPAFGALLTFTQSWLPEGLALGQLLHTVALAPGESTRLAMIDWSRRTSASTQEGISESEQLTANIERTRSIAEIVSAVAKDAQDGFSRSRGMGAGASAGHAGGGAGSVDLSSLLGLPLKFAGGSGDSLGLSIGGSDARTSSWTTGQRDLSANMAQNVLDRTHQASASARNRWATIVREVSQTESERISTRTVTNYNHMHALSIEYFEVVQLYRVTVDLARVAACLFVPMKLIDFNKTGVIPRYKRVIAAVGLTPQIRGLMFSDPDMLLLSSPSKDGNWLATDVQVAQAMFGEPIGEATANTLALPLNFSAKFLTYDGEAPFESFALESSNGVVTNAPIAWSGRWGTYGAALETLYGPTMESAAAFWDVVAIRAKKKASSASWAGEVTFYLRMESLQREGFSKPQPGSTDIVQIRVKVSVLATTTEVTVFEMTRIISGRSLRQHLMDNQLYYSQCIWSSLDSTTIAQLLAGHTFRGKFVLSEVDPLPVTVAGNFLVFRKHEPVDAASRTQWAQWLASREIKLGERKTDLVPLPSGGVFAEAVLGRYNSAEKLDITRFWNWADSPIPITPPEISAIQAGSRARPEDLIPGQLPPAVLKVEQAPDVPDPQGLTAILQALQNGSMFRDMSGMNATIGFAQAALTRAFDAARDAASQAGENMKTAADIYKSAFGGQGGIGGTASGTAGRPMAMGNQSPGTISNTGSRINYGEKLDQRNSRGVPNIGGGNNNTNAPYDYGSFPFGRSQDPMATQAFIADMGTTTPSYQLASWPTGTSSSNRPLKLLSGDAATSKAAQLLESAQPVTLPDGGILHPGTIWNDNSILVSANVTYAYYLKDGDLYEWGTIQFIRYELLTAWQQGVSSAKTWIVLAEIEIALLAGIFVGVKVLIVVTLVDSGLRLYHNRVQVQAAYQAGWKVASALNCIRTTSPELWAQLKKATFWAIIDNAPREVSMKTVAFWLGRIIGGIGKAAPGVTLAAIIGIVAKVTAIITAIHTPALVGQALEKAIAGKVAGLKTSFNSQGIEISDDDAKALMRSLNSNHQAIACLGELKDALDDLNPVLEQLVPQVMQ